MSKMLSGVSDWIIVRPTPVPEQQGGIHIPEKARSTAPDGTVVSIGIRAQGEGIAVGDHVLLAPYGWNEVEFTGEKLYVTTVRQILGKIEDVKKSR